MTDGDFKANNIRPKYMTRPIQRPYLRPHFLGLDLYGNLVFNRVVKQWVTIFTATITRVNQRVSIAVSLLSEGLLFKSRGFAQEI